MMEVKTGRVIKRYEQFKHSADIYGLGNWRHDILIPRFQSSRSMAEEDIVGSDHFMVVD